MGDKGKGKGKGKDKGKDLKAVDDSLKVWVGGLTAETCKNWKSLQDHFNGAGKTTWVQAMGKEQNTAVVCYKTAEEAENAILTLNGSSIGDDVIEVDTWVKKPKESA